jgi:hypothetical protein
MCHLIEAKASSLGNNNKLYTFTRSRQFSYISFPLRTSYKPCPDSKSISCGNKMQLIFKQLWYVQGTTNGSYTTGCTIDYRENITHPINLI